MGPSARAPAPNGVQGVIGLRFEDVNRPRPWRDHRRHNPQTLHREAGARQQTVAPRPNPGRSADAQYNRSARTPQGRRFEPPTSPLRDRRGPHPPAPLRDRRDTPPPARIQPGTVLTTTTKSSVFQVGAERQPPWSGAQASP